MPAGHAIPALAGSRIPLFDYNGLVAAAGPLLDVAGALGAASIVDRFGRVRSQVSLFTMATFGLMAFNACSRAVDAAKENNHAAFFLWPAGCILAHVVSRLALAAASACAAVATTELIVTLRRGAVCGFLMASSRLGGAAALVIFAQPFAGDGAVSSPAGLPAAWLAPTASALAAVGALSLPETVGVDLAHAATAPEEDSAARRAKRATAHTAGELAERW